jgi:hypothetical protein
MTLYFHLGVSSPGVPSVTLLTTRHNGVTVNYHA